MWDRVVYRIISEQKGRARGRKGCAGSARIYRGMSQDVRELNAACVRALFGELGDKVGVEINAAAGAWDCVERVSTANQGIVVAV